MFDFRFHLGAGQYYKYWQVKNVDSGEAVYYNRKDFFFVLYDCVLKNNPSKAEKVYASQRRDVCGYVRCSKYSVHNYEYSTTIEYGDELLYDPKITPYWKKENDSTIYDNTKYNKLVTSGRRIFVMP